MGKLPSYFVCLKCLKRVCRRVHEWYEQVRDYIIIFTHKVLSKYCLCAFACPWTPQFHRNKPPQTVLRTRHQQTERLERFVNCNSNKMSEADALLITGVQKLSAQQIFQQYRTSADGLTSAEAKKIRENVGLNQIPPPLSAPAWLCCLLPCLLRTKSMEAYHECVPEHAQVRRNKNYVNLDANSIVPGDIVKIESGSRVPADVRIIESRYTYTHPTHNKQTHKHTHTHTHLSHKHKHTHTHTHTLSLTLSLSHTHHIGVVFLIPLQSMANPKD